MSERRCSRVIPCVLVAIVLANIAVLPVAAECCPILPFPQQESSVRLYDEAIYVIERGGRMVPTIAKLEKATQLAPEEIKYHTALATALACRAAFIASAYRATKQRKWDIESVTKIMRKNNQSSGLPDGLKRPIATPDDPAPFHMTDGEVNTSVNDLCVRSLSEWDKALALCKSAEETAEVWHLQGRVIQMVTFAARNDLEFPEDYLGKPITIPKNISRQYAVHCLSEACQQIPNNPIYLRAFAEALLDDKTTGNTARALETYYAYLQLVPKDTATHFRVFELEKERDKEEAVHALSAAARSDTDNAFLWLSLARVRASTLTTDPSLEVLELVEKANGMNRFIMPVYTPNVPRILKAIWGRMCGSSPKFDPAKLLFQSTELSSALSAVVKDVGGQADLQSRIGNAEIGTERMLLRCITGDPESKRRFFGEGEDVTGLVLMTNTVLKGVLERGYQRLNGNAIGSFPTVLNSDLRASYEKDIQNLNSVLSILNHPSN